MQKKLSSPLIKKSGELNWLLGALLVSLGVAICNRANLGVSMIAALAFIIHDALLQVTSALSIGVIEYLVQGFIILLTCLIVKRFNWRYLLSFLTAVIYGYFIDMWMLIIGTEPFDALWMRWIMLIVGDVVIAVGVAFFFRTYLPVEAYELCVHEIVRVHKFDFAKTKWVFDFSCLGVSIILALSIFGDVKTFDWSTIYANSFHHIGLGTIVTAIISAPIIKLASKLLVFLVGTDALIKPVYKLLHIEDKAKKNSMQKTEEKTDEVEEVFAETASSQPCDEK